MLHGFSWFKFHTTLNLLSTFLHTSLKPDFFADGSMTLVIEENFANHRDAILTVPGCTPMKSKVILNHFSNRRRWLWLSKENIGNRYQYSLFSASIYFKIILCPVPYILPRQLSQVAKCAWPEWVSATAQSEKRISNLTDAETKKRNLAYLKVKLLVSAWFIHFSEPPSLTSVWHQSVLKHN